MQIAGLAGVWASRERGGGGGARADTARLDRLLREAAEVHRPRALCIVR